MPISADKVRELAGRGEGATIDFKRDQYDVTEANINAEIAKDVMALANSLRAGGEPGYLLIGVTNEGDIVGIPPTDHLDDADVHRRIASHLQQSPRFSYSSVDVDGLSIGVFEIESAGRPFYPSKDSGNKLLHRVALYRNGSTTERASPHLIQEWLREDDRDLFRVRSMQLEEHEAERRVSGAIIAFDKVLTKEELRLVIFVRNYGRRSFEIKRLHWTVHWTPKFFAAVREGAAARLAGGMDPAVAERLQMWSTGTLPPDYDPPTGKSRPTYRSVIAPNEPWEHVTPWKWKIEHALAHLRWHQIPVDGFDDEWLAIHFELEVVGELGAEDVIDYVFASK